MQPYLKKLALPVASLFLLTLAGCSFHTTGQTEAAKIAESIGHIRPSKGDTCETQRQVAAQSSKIDTIITGKETVYKPKPCKEVPASQPPSTS